MPMSFLNRFASSTLLSLSLLAPLPLCATPPDQSPTSRPALVSTLTPPPLVRVPAPLRYDGGGDDSTDGCGGDTSGEGGGDGGDSGGGDSSDGGGDLIAAPRGV